MKKKVVKEKPRVTVEAAEDLGLAEKVSRAGWGSLTSREAGRLGPLVRKKRSSDGGKPGEG